MNIDTLSFLNLAMGIRLPPSCTLRSVDCIMSTNQAIGSPVKNAPENMSAGVFSLSKDWSSQLMRAINSMNGGTRLLEFGKLLL